jgi:glycosyltransferase involved in cell wall biosynthesis
MSNIPAFLEHIDVLGVRAQVFDPYDSKDIADKIAFILSDPERARADAEYSRLAISRKTWDDTAAGYLRVFMRAVKPSASSTAGSLQMPNTV